MGNFFAREKLMRSTIINSPGVVCITICLLNLCA